MPLTKHSPHYPKIFNYFLIFILLMCFGCTSLAPLSKRNLAGFYQTESYPAVQNVYMDTENNAITLHILINTKGAHYKADKNRTAKYSVYRCGVIFRDNYTVAALLDSVSIRRQINLSTSGDTVLFSFPLSSSALKASLAEINVCDIIKGNCKTILYKINPQEVSTGFSLSPDAFEGGYSGNSYISGNHYINLFPAKAQNLEVSISRFIRTPRVPLSIFSESYPMLPDHGPDSVWTQKGFEIPVKKPGVYIIQTAKNGHGISILSKPDKIKQPPHPIRYLTSTEEYTSFFSAKNHENAISDFWLRITGSPQRAALSASLFDKRVRHANKYFTETQAGWATDRGMLFIVFGEPGEIYRSEDTETWVYPPNDTESQLRFDFRIETRFGIEHFHLNRNSSYKEVWNKALERWRR